MLFFKYDIFKNTSLMKTLLHKKKLRKLNKLFLL